MQLLQVTTEHNTMKVMFDQLSTSFKVGSPPTKSAEMYPKVRFWTQTKYNEWTTTAEAHADCRWKVAFLEDEEGKPVSEDNNLEDTAECSAHGEAKQEDKQEDNTNADNELGPGTSKKRKAKRCKSKVAGKKIKVLSSEVDFNTPSPPPASSCSLSTQSSLPDSSPSSSGSMSLADNSSSPGPSGPSSSPISPKSDVQPKPVHRMAVITPPPPGSTMEAHPPAAVPTPVAMAPSSILPTTVVGSDDEASTSSSAAENYYSAILAKNALKIKIPPLPATLSASKEKDNEDEAHSTVPTTSTSASTAKRSNVILNRKMRPTKNKTGYNLCAWRWITQVNKNGTSEEFRDYWNKWLGESQREVYTKEALKLTVFEAP
ncbi:hypothetical protein BDN67DRAFT_986228 [Paxillus ammoniavirescens]|nr:hypothetical protein BDN67DRAFT_986228 [Paxillus ammoniavirescens]